MKRRKNIGLILLFCSIFLIGSAARVLAQPVSQSETINITATVGGFCGDNIIESPEQCDGTDLGSATCVTKGFAGGILNCNASCNFDTSSCIHGGGSSHNECSAQKCISVPTFGTNQCSVDTDCQCDTHGDINKDGKIDVVDFSILMYFWQDTNPSNPCADINQDGKVELTDFSIMLYWWTG